MMPAQRHVERLISSLSVNRRVLLGFGVVLALVAFLGIQSIRHIGIIGQGMMSTLSTGQEALEMSGLARQSERLSRIILTYVNAQTEKSLANAQAEMARFEQSLNAVAATAIGTHGSGQFSAVQDRAKEYRAAFEAVIAAVAQRRDGMDQTFLVGAQLNTTAMAIVDVAVNGGEQDIVRAAVRVQQALQATRISAARYLSTSDPNDVAAAQNELTKLGEVVGALRAFPLTPRMERFVGAMTRDTEGFTQGLDKAAAGSRALEAAQGRLYAAVDTLGEAIRQVLDAFTATQQAAQASATDTLVASQTQALVTPAVAIIVGITFALLIGASIVRPIRMLTAAMVTLAEGDTATEIPAVDNRDEVGAMARAVQVFKENAIAVQRMQAEQARQQQLTEEAKHQAVLALADSFETSMRGIVEIVSTHAAEVELAAEALSSAAEETQNRAVVGASASTQASTNVQTVAAATGQLSASIQEIGRQVEDSTAVARTSVEEANRANAMIAGLSEAAQRIGAVLRMINHIAHQTNLLALNATIEAARAGDAGQGFAVVANEVRGLANQTAKATEEIEAQVNAVQSATGEAVKAIEGITATIAHVNDITIAIAAAIQEQTSATEEIARSVQQASQGVGEVSTNIAGVRQASVETGQASAELLRSSGLLAEQADVLRRDVDQFIARIRAE